MGRIFNPTKRERQKKKLEQAAKLARSIAKDAKEKNESGLLFGSNGRSEDEMGAKEWLEGEAKERKKEREQMKMAREKKQREKELEKSAKDAANEAVKEAGEELKRREEEEEVRGGDGLDQDSLALVMRKKMMAKKM